MPEISNNEWFQKHVVDALERLEAGQTAMITKYEAHEKSDAEQFEDIRFELATTKAAHEATAKSEAKLWGVIGGGISLAVSSAVHFLTKGR